MSILVATQTDIGLKRAQNEDHHGSWISDQDPEHVVLVIADGMGGAQAGEIASHMAVEHVLDETRAAEPNASVENLQRVVEGANRLIHEASLAQSDRRGMGTTCTAVVLHGANATFAHVGDSRLYLIRDREIRQITRDHSLVAQLLEANHLTPEEARSDPRRNVVTRSVGVGENVEVDGGSLTLVPGDTLLLSTDGLHGLASDAELAAHAQGPDLERACRDLVELARSRGGHDNITVVLARMSGGA